MTEPDGVQYGEWHREGFGALYPVVYAHRTVAAAAPEAAFAHRCCNITPDCRVLDLCCGNGRHLAHLARQTPHAVGLDYSDALLALAGPLVGSSARLVRGHTARLVRGDMRALPFADHAFDVVTNFFTSFGYFLEEEQNVRAARELARVLAPGGRFFVDFMNADCVRATLVPESEREYNGYVIRERRWLDGPPERVNKATTVLRDGDVVGQWTESVRLYAPDEFTALLAECELAVTALFGDYDGGAVAPDRPRLIATGRKEQRTDA